jgi:hypothetical protein
MIKMNKTELTVAEKYRKEGFTVIKPSWPDLFAVKEGKIILIEVKDCRDELSGSQIKSFEVLEKAGLEVRCAKFITASLETFNDLLFDDKIISLVRKKYIHWRHSRIVEKKTVLVKKEEKDKWEGFLKPTKSDITLKDQDFTEEEDEEIDNWLHIFPKSPPNQEEEEGSK